MKPYKKDFGAQRRGGYRKDDRFAQKANFQTTCSQCGNDCTVPFKPNGRKPVLCSTCFRGGEGSYSERPRFEERKPFRRSYDRPRFDEPKFEKRQPDVDLRDDMKQIKRKLDRILQILEEVTVTEEEA